jgi:hypothetical protein
VIDPGTFERLTAGYSQVNPMSLEDQMLIIGLILLVLGFLLDVSFLWTLGIILIIIGAVLFLLGASGHPVAGRRHYW